MITNDKLTFKDSYSDFTSFIDEDSGFLRINGIVARTGIQVYSNAEVGDYNEPLKMVNVYRPRDEVLKEESLSTYANAPITDDHPNTFVTVDNAMELIKGSVALENKFKREQENNLSSEIAKTETILGLKKYIEALENRSCEGCIYVGKSNCINCLSCKRQYSDNWRNK